MKKSLIFKLLFILAVLFIFVENTHIVQAKKKKKKGGNSQGMFGNGNKVQMIFINLRKGYEGHKTKGGIKKVSQDFQ